MGSVGRSRSEGGADNFSDITPDDLTLLMLQMLISLALGSLVVVQIRAMAVYGLEAPASSEADEPYSAIALLQDFRSFMQFVIGVMLCLAVQPEMRPRCRFGASKLSSLCLFL